jgi:hypothetical protein
MKLLSFILLLVVLIQCTKTNPISENQNTAKAPTPRFIIGSWEGVYEIGSQLYGEQPVIQKSRMILLFREDGTLKLTTTTSNEETRTTTSKYYFADEQTIVSDLFSFDLRITKKSDGKIRFSPVKADPNDPHRVSIEIIYVCDFIKISE